VSLDAYKQARARTERPRAVEQRLMTEITNEMIGARTSKCSGSQLMPALHRNREVWTIFSAVCSAVDNKLPVELRAGVVSLSLWVDRHTSEVVAGRESIDDLIDVNLAIIEGLASFMPEAANA
jgi:flagellar biosynthesis activator protein FlaF